MDQLDVESESSKRGDTPGWGTVIAWLLAGLAAAYWLARRALRRQT